MKKSILTLAVLTSLSSMAFAAEDAAPDMSDPTDVYTTLGFGYGNQGLDISSMLLLSSTETHKSGIIFDAKNVLDEDSHLPGNTHKWSDLRQDRVHNTSYRLRWGKINTTNGLGLTIDAVNADHDAFGRISVIQAGTLATLPIGDDLLIFPIAFIGTVIGEDNSAIAAQGVVNGAKQKYVETAMAGGASYTAAMTAASTDATLLQLQANADLAVQTSNLDSDGMNMMSTIMTAMVYVRYGITDNLWALGSYTYTDDIQGKDWNEDVTKGGLQLANQSYDLTIGYQITPTQNITAYIGSDENTHLKDAKWKIGYNYAF